MKFKAEMAVAASALLMSGAAAEAQADQVQPIDPALVEFCINEAIGVSDTADRTNYNPADFVGSGYVGRSLLRFYFEDVAPEVSADCLPVIKSRTTVANQIYRGKVNTPKSVVFSGLGKINNDRQVVKLKRPFTGIKGPAVRGYDERVTTTVVAADGTIFSKTGEVIVRGQSDGV